MIDATEVVVHEVQLNRVSEVSNFLLKPLVRRGPSTCAWSGSIVYIGRADGRYSRDAWNCVVQRADALIRPALMLRTLAGALHHGACELSVVDATTERGAAPDTGALKHELRCNWRKGYFYDPVCVRLQFSLYSMIEVAQKNSQTLSARKLKRRNKVAITSNDNNRLH